MSKQQHTAQATVVAVTRHGHTVYGNPIMTVVLQYDDTERETFRISDNASLVYEIENPEFREQPHTFTLTAAGRISGRVR
jgi:hypothetical protein